MSPVTDVSDQRLVIGTDETRRQAREELKLHVAVQRAMRSGLPEFPRGDREFQRFGIVEHRHTGALYHVQLGQLDDPDRSGAVAFFIRRTERRGTSSSRLARRRARRLKRSGRRSSSARPSAPRLRRPNRGRDAVDLGRLHPFARVYNSSLLDGPPRFTGTLYARGSLRFKPADLDIPLVIDHDMNQEIGRVRKIEEIKDIDGRWYVALATVTQRPAWLQRHTGASFESKPLASMEMNGWRIVQRAPVTEVTVTSPTHEPRDVGAKVLLLDEMPEPKRAAGNREGEPTRGSGIIRRSEPTVASLEEEELRRRIAWCEATYGRVDVEMVLRGMRLEKNGPSLDELLREHRVTTAA